MVVKSIRIALVVVSVMAGIGMAEDLPAPLKLTAQEVGVRVGPGGVGVIVGVMQGT